MCCVLLMLIQRWWFLVVLLSAIILIYSKLTDRTPDSSLYFPAQLTVISDTCTCILLMFKWITSLSQNTPDTTGGSDDKI